MEAYIIKTSGLNTSTDFFKSINRKTNAPMTKIYNEINNANAFAKELSLNNDITLDQILQNKNNF